MEDNSSINQYTTMSELQAFAQAQQKVLTQLNKKIQKLEQENTHLKDLLEKSVPILSTQKELKANQSLANFGSSDEESIAREQLFLLKQTSKDRDLTLEETRRFEIYTKILLQIKNTRKPEEKEAEKLSTEQLLKIAESSDNDNQ